MPLADFTKGTKLCNGPGHSGTPTELPIDDFGKSRRAKDGRTKWCRKCRTVYSQTKSARKRKATREKVTKDIATTVESDGTTVADYLRNMRIQCGGLRRLAALHWEQINLMKDGSFGKVQAINSILKVMIANEKMTQPKDPSDLSDKEIDRELAKMLGEVAARQIAAARRGEGGDLLQIPHTSEAEVVDDDD